MRSQIKIYNILQFIVFVIFIYLAHLRINQGTEFKWTNELNFVSFFLSVGVLLKTIVDKISGANLNKSIKDKFVFRLNMILCLFLIISVISFSIYRLRHNVSNEVGDPLSIIALAIALCNDLLSSFIKKIILRNQNEGIINKSRYIHQ